MPEQDSAQSQNTATLELQDPFVQPEVSSPEKRELDFIKYVVIGIVLVLFLGLLALVFQFGAAQSAAWAEKQGSYIQLQNEVHDNNTKVDDLKNEIKDLKQQTKKMHDELQSLKQPQ